MPVSRPVTFTPAAQAEAAEAQAWYETRAPGLGRQFRAELAAGALPRRVPGRAPGPLHRFSYSLFFRIRPTAVVVLACFHARRDPRRWQWRVER